MMVLEFTVWLRAFALLLELKAVLKLVRGAFLLLALGGS